MDNYWTRRADLLMKSVHQDEDQVLKQVLNGYNQALSEINTTINTLLYKGKYGSESVDDLLSVATTKQEVDKLYKLFGSVSDTDEKAYYKLQIDQLAYKARIARAEIVKANIQMQIGKLTQAQENLVHSGFSDIAGNVYDKSIFEVQQQFGYAFAFERPNNRMIEQVIKSNWSGVVWSDRLWKNNQQLAESLQRTLTKGLSQGKSYFLMARDLKDEMGSAEYPAVRLIRTEASYIANKARLQALTNSGVSELEFVAVLDARTSDICQENDGAIVPVDKVVFGLNIPPLHPNCRSTFVAKIDDAYKKNMTRLSTNPVTGEKEKVPRSMTYNEWRQSMYDRYGRPATDTAIKQIKNTNADRTQYEKYKETVGLENLPKTFEDFQQMKYTDSKEWWLTKGYAKAVSSGDISSFTGMDVYRATAAEIDAKLVGIETSKWNVITGYSYHFIDRTIGQVANGFSHTGLREGVPVDISKDTLLNPVGITELRKSVTYVSDYCKVTFDPHTGNLVQVNPYSKGGK